MNGKGGVLTGSAFFHFEKVLKFSIVKNNPNVFLMMKRFELFQIGWGSWIRTNE